MIIYKAINSINGKVYIGQTINTIKKRIKGHRNASKKSKSYFHNAIKKYGLDNFTWEVLEQCDSLEMLNEREIFWIDFFKSNKIGYNQNGGGNSKGTFSEETKKKISFANSGEKSGWFGRRHTEETKRKISEANKGHRLTDEQLQKMINSKKGKCPKQLEYKKVKIVCLNNNKIYNTCTEACNELGVSSGNLSGVLSGRLGHTKGYRFKQAA